MPSSVLTDCSFHQIKRDKERSTHTHKLSFLKSERTQWGPSLAAGGQTTLELKKLNRTDLLLGGSCLHQSHLALSAVSN